MQYCTSLGVDKEWTFEEELGISLYKIHILGAYSQILRAALHAHMQVEL